MNEVNQLILFLNNNKKFLKLITKASENISKAPHDFQKAFKENNSLIIISDTIDLFGYKGDLIFEKNKDILF